MLSLSKAALSTIFWVFGITRPGIEPRFSGPLANILLFRSMARLNDKYFIKLLEIDMFDHLPVCK